MQKFIGVYTKNYFRIYENLPQYMQEIRGL